MPIIEVQILVFFVPRLRQKRGLGGGIDMLSDVNVRIASTVMEIIDTGRVREDHFDHAQQGYWQ